MADKVDVRAVMQLAGRELECVGTGHSAPLSHIERLAVEVDEARAAFDDLIWKADNAAKILHNAIEAGHIDGYYRAHLADLTAAVANAGGAA